MNNTLGGINEPSVPPMATEPDASDLEYPKRSISGIAMRPMAAAQATDEPVIAANPPHPITEAIATPPGSLVSHNRAAR